MGNTFAESLGSAGRFLYPEEVEFFRNTVRRRLRIGGDDLSREYLDIRHNHFFADVFVDDGYDVPPDLSQNYWGHTLPLGDPKPCWEEDKTYNPPVTRVVDYDCPSNWRISGYAQDVLPGLRQAVLGTTKPVDEANGPRIGPVNTAAGTLHHRATDLALNDAGEEIALTRAYRSDVTSSTDLGAGWSHAFEQELTPADLDSQTTLDLPDGTAVPYVRDDDGAYIPSPGVDAELAEKTTGFGIDLPENSTTSFDAEGELTSYTIRDPGHEVSVARSNGLVSGVTGVSGRSMTFNRSGGTLASVTDSTGRSVGYTVSGDQLASVEGVAGGTETYGYDADGRLTSIRSPLDRHVLSAGYDAQGRVAWVSHNGVDKTTFEYHPAESYTLVNRPDGTQWRHDYDDRGRLVHEEAIGGAYARHVVYDGSGRVAVTLEGLPTEAGESRVPTVETTLHDDRGNPTTLVDGEGNATEITYDDERRPVTTTYPDGGELTRSYDADGRPTTLTDPEGGVWDAAFNSFGQLTSLTDPLGRTATWSYTSSGDLSSATNTAGETTTYTADTLGRITAVTNPAGETTAYGHTPWGALESITSPSGATRSVAHDADRLVTSATDPLGETTSYVYDDAGRLVEQADPAGGRWGIAYDELDRRATVTDPRGGTFTYTYSPDGDRATLTDPTGATTRFTYSAPGRLARRIDPLGAVTEYAYDGTGRLAKVVAPDGGTRTLVYDGKGRLAEHTDPRGGTTAVTYDRLDRPTSKTDPLGAEETFAYDPVGNLLSRTDRTGATTTYAYDAADRLTEETDPVGTVASYAYDAAGRVTERADGRGATWTYGYDADGQVVGVTDPEGGTMTYERDATGRVTAVDDELDRRTTVTYDVLGRPTRRDHPDGTNELFTYDAAGNLVSRTDRTGETWSYTFDAANRVTTETDPTGAATTYTYDGAGRRTSATDPTGVETRFAYDPVGRQTARIDPAGATWSKSYAPDGALVEDRDPAGVATTYGYDAAGRRVSMADASGNTTTYGYDAEGRLTSTTDPLGRTTSTTYDARGRVIATADGTGAQTAYAYDAADNRTGETSPEGRTWSWTYDLAGRLTSAADPMGHTTSYTHDAAGQLTGATLPRGGSYAFDYDPAGRRIRETDPLGAATEFAHDGEGRLLRTAYPSGRVVSRTLDPAGRLVREEAGDEWRTRSYDPAGRLTEAASPDGSLAFAYGPRGLLQSVTDSAGAVTYGFDAAHRLATRQVHDNPETTFSYDERGLLAHLDGRVDLSYTYDDAGQLSTIDTPSILGSTERFAYDAAGRLTSHSLGGTLFFANELTYSPDGKVVSQEQWIAGNPSSGITAYAYDAAGRLTEADGPQEALRYTWDADGNRTSVQRDDEDPVTYTYDLADRLVASSDGRTYDHDADGHLESINGPLHPLLTHTYDGFGDLSGSEVPTDGDDVRTIRYARDGLGRLAARSVDGQAAQRLTYDGEGREVVEVAEPDGRTTHLTRTPEGALSQVAARSPQTDDEVLARAVTNAHGDLAALLEPEYKTALYSAVYAPFGEASETGARLVPLTFQSAYTDPLTGVVDLGARAYDPALGRFTAPDEILGDPREPITLNRYTYGNADPLAHIDPDGRFARDLVEFVLGSEDPGDFLSAWVEVNEERGAAAMDAYVESGGGLSGGLDFFNLTANPMYPFADAGATEYFESGGGVVGAFHGANRAFNPALPLLENCVGGAEGRNAVGCAVSAVALTATAVGLHGGGKAMLGRRAPASGVDEGLTGPGLSRTDEAVGPAPAAIDDAVRGPGTPVGSNAELVRAADFADDAAAFSHYSKHAKGIEIRPKGSYRVKRGGADLPEFGSFAEYRNAARSFMSPDAPPGVLQAHRGTDLMRVDPKSGYFGVRTQDGTIRTFFRPDADPVAYFWSRF